MADLEFKSWDEFKSQVGDRYRESDTDLLARVFKRASKLVYSDNAIGVYLDASCKKAALSRLNQLASVGWSAATTPHGKGGVVVALTTTITQGNTMITPNTTNTTITTPTNAAPAPAAPAAPLSIDQQIAALMAACASTQQSAAVSAAAVKSLSTEVSNAAAAAKAAADAATAASNVASSAAKAADEAKTTADDAAKAASEAAASAAKISADIIAIRAEVAQLQAPAKKEEKKKNKKGEKNESGFLAEYSTEEKIVGAAVAAAVVYAGYRFLTKE